jgi:iron complex transport system substrate-binding protein
MIGSRRRAVLASGTALVLLTGCAAATSSRDATATDETVPLDRIARVTDPGSLRGPSTAVLTDRSVTPLEDTALPVLPTTVTSHDRDGDRDVVVRSIDRVLALDLSGSIASTVWGLGLGDHLVGRDVSTTFPEAKDLPLVTSGGHSVNAEAVLATRPSIVVTDGSIGPRDVVEQLRDAGVTVVFLDRTSSFDGAGELARDVAGVLGVPAAGDRLAARIAAETSQVRGQVEAIAPTDPDRRLSMLFLYLRGSGGIYYLLGQDSGAGDLIDGLGGVDLAAERGWEEAQPLTDEALVSADPDLVLVMTDGLASVGGIDRLLADKPSVALTTAGRNRRFVDMADGDVLSFGPRSADVLAALARAVYAPGAAT